MASIAKDPGGKKRITWGPTGARKTLRLGRATIRQAETVRGHIEHLLARQKFGTALPADTEEWLASRDGAWNRKLSRVGLVVQKPTTLTVLGPFLAAYVAGRTDVKPATAIVYGHTRRNLLTLFGETKPLADVTYADATRFRRWLTDDQQLAEATVRRRCTMARQFFSFAVDDRLIKENPFAKLKGIGVKANRARDFYLSAEDSAKVLAACPSAEWRLIFALARWGGLRTPSETFALTWDGVDWTAGRIHVPAVKTKARAIPIFPELRPLLQDVFDPGERFILRRGAGDNLRTQFSRIVARAGLTPWPKLFQNLRSTRETELAEAFPIHVVCEWIGNSQVVARKHYLQVTAEHFATAVERGAKSGARQVISAHGPSRRVTNRAKKRGD